MVYLPAIGYYLQGGIIYFADAKPTTSSVLYWTGQFYVDGLIYPYANVEAMARFLNILGYFVNILGIISTIAGAFLFFCFFRSYWPDHYVFAGVLSIFGFFGIFAFIIRNKKRVDYGEYIRSKFNVYNGYNGANRNPNAGGPYGGPYGGGYSGGTGESDDDFGWNESRGEHGNGAPSEDPFGEFGGNGSDNGDDKQ